jgi:alpha-D-ribose 1-methylphosphonate 5-triphosphate synthase subunit PhnL
MSAMNQPYIDVVKLSKSFTLHVQGGVRLIAFEGLDLKVFPGECLALSGPSGSGKSSLLRSLYANYMPQAGHIWVRHNHDLVDMVSAPPRLILDVRRKTMGFVSQFLRVIPRVSTIDIVSEPLRRQGTPREEATARAEDLLDRLNIPPRLWTLPPATFSGGEQQRVNVARGFIRDYPILLLDEPTASLDIHNRNTVLELINNAKNRGAAVVGIFHDPDVCRLVADRIYEMRP